MPTTLLGLKTTDDQAFAITCTFQLFNCYVTDHVMLTLSEMFLKMLNEYISFVKKCDFGLVCYGD